MNELKEKQKQLANEFRAKKDEERKMNDELGKIRNQVTFVFCLYLFFQKN